MQQVFVSIGSNIDSERNVRLCIAALRRKFSRVRLSTVYQTPPVGFAGDDFYNLVASFCTSLSVSELLACLRRIEGTQGRARGEHKFAPRSLDIDLLLYGDLIIHEGRLVLPRPDISQYPFVLGPLAELAPNVVHPVLGESFRSMWKNFAERKPPMQPVPMVL